MILAIIGQIGTDGGQGYIDRVPRRGDQRAVHGGPHDGLQHVDRGRRAGRADRAGRDDVRVPQGPPARTAGRRLGRGVEYWKSLPTDEGAVFDHEVTIDATTLTPYVTWGTNPGQALAARRERACARRETKDPNATERALTYMGLTAGTPSA